MPEKKESMICLTEQEWQQLKEDTKVEARKMANEAVLAAVTPLLEDLEKTKTRIVAVESERDFWRGCTVGAGISAVLIAILAALGWLIPR